MARHLIANLSPGREAAHRHPDVPVAEIRPALREGEAGGAAPAALEGSGRPDPSGTKPGLPLDEPGSAFPEPSLPLVTPGPVLPGPGLPPAEAGLAPAEPSPSLVETGRC